MDQQSTQIQDRRNNFLQWCMELKRFATPNALVLFLLGFSAGLPFLLVAGGTISAWLKDAGLEYRTIGFFAWVGHSFSLKALWAPFIDGLRLPLLWRLGQRRSWLITSQLGIAVGLYIMSTMDPSLEIASVAWAAVFVAFCSATQDVSVDAYRIEVCDMDMQGVVTSAYIAGYRIALLVAGAGALFIAEGIDWQWAYKVMACLMGIGIATVLFMKEPNRTESDQLSAAKLKKAHEKWQARLPAASKQLLNILAWTWEYVVEPFAEMLSRFGRWILLLLAVVLFYRISDIAMGNMANPFYLALGYTKSDIAWVIKIFGLLMVLVGSAFGGILVARKGLFVSMMYCLLAVITTNLLFALLAHFGADCLSEQHGQCVPPNLLWLSMVVSADNLAGGASQVAFIAFLSHQVNLEFSATQYALMSSIMTLLGKFISGFSGIVVESYGFSWFFVYVSCLGIPSIFLISALRYCCPQSFQNFSTSVSRSKGK